METTPTTQTPIEATAPRPLTNREMAAILFNIATVLRDEGNVNRWRTEAYERGARALMAHPNEAYEILATTDTVPFRRRWHIGKKLQAKIGEMARSGQLDQYRSLLAMQGGHRAELMHLPGIGPRTADRLHQQGISTARDLVRAARNGRLQAVPGFGSKRTRTLASVPVTDAAEPNLFTL